MKKAIVAAVVALGSIVMPASPALAEHCLYPFIEPNPIREPFDWIRYQVTMAEYYYCRVTHR